MTKYIPKHDRERQHAGSIPARGPVVAYGVMNRGLPRSVGPTLHEGFSGLPRPLNAHWLDARMRAVLGGMGTLHVPQPYWEWVTPLSVGRNARVVSRASWRATVPGCHHTARGA